ncbi:hypothetical protein QBC46DRAFT_220171, partial [Diplogelasinospora grovesii]
DGHILIMTTNYPDRLDKALIRPGRIDYQVEFTNATREQVKGLFTNMYDPNSPTRFTPPESDPGSSNSEAKMKEIIDMAHRFCAAIPEGLFSPAEVHGFLLKRKHNPSLAVDDVMDWVRAAL